MIPGPVTGRTPIDPGAQRQPTEAPGETADPGASFADLLAAMLAPAAAASVEPQPSVSAPRETVFERLDSAEIFNETGLFRGAAPLPSPEAAEAAPRAEPPRLAQLAQAAAAQATAVKAAVPAPIQASDPQAGPQVAALSPPADPAAPPPAATATPAAQAAAGDGPEASFAAPSRAGPRTLLSPRHPPAPPLPGTTPPVGEARGETESPGRVPPRAASMVARLVAASTAAAAPQVSVQAAEGGISVTARVDKLSREERDRLRAAIGELLARHGFAGARI
ncbi:MAG TPA: hypothetical protein VEA60_14145, partial [Allosphingosinicella sp.]|nr:hypothetical protein [Allosphingosinicella sp.]